MKIEPGRVYVVVWDCINPQAIAVFEDHADALRFCDAFKARVDALMKSLLLTGHERVYVWSAAMNPDLDLEAERPTV